MAEIKYVAAGFLEDAEKLLGDFVKENNTKFSIFAKVWKERNFSLIFMGRGSEEELIEFTQEIFYLSTQFLTSNSLIRQVGAVYLLYALFRNQVISPPVRIRVVLDHMKVIQALCDKLPFDEHKTFHYVLSYMTKNSFDFVAYPKLMGPTVPSVVADVYQGTDENSILKFHAGLKSDMAEMAESKVLKETGDMFAKYIEMKSSLNLNVLGIGPDTAESFENFSSRLNGLLDRAKTTLPVLVRKEPATSDIGLRRVHLKSKAFCTPPVPKIPNEQKLPFNDDDFELDAAIDKPLPLRKRFPKPRRNVGRPKKLDKDNEDVSLDVTRRRRRPRKPRRRTCTSTRHYYSETEDLKLLSNYENRTIPKDEDAKWFTDDSDVDNESETVVGTSFVEDSDCDDPEPVSQLQNGTNSEMAIKDDSETSTQAADDVIEIKTDPETTTHSQDRQVV